MRYVNVAIPHTHLDVLTYNYDRTRLPGLAPGDCVSVSLRGKKVRGLVLELLAESPVKRTVAVEDVVEPGMLDGRLLQLVRWVNSYYFGRMGETLGLALPRGVCGYGLRPRELATPTVDETAATGPPLTPPGFGVWVSLQSGGREEILVRFVGQVLQTGSAIVLAPEHEFEQLAGRLAARLGVEPVLFHGKLKPRERKQAWRNLRAGTRCLAVGVRAAVFAPVSDLAGIAVVDEHEPVFKEERRPAFHARDVAVYRGKLARCPVALFDPTPSAETWRNLQTGVYRELVVDRTARSRQGPHGAWWSVIDLRRHKGEVIAPMLRREIERGAVRGAVMLYVNRRGIARQVACNDCGNTLACPDCSVPMVLDRVGLKCPYCGRTDSAPESCPSCRGSDFRFRAPGVELVVREVAKLVPGATVTAVVTESCRRLEPGPGHVFVGTRTLLSATWPDQVSLVAVVAVDGELCRSDFRAHERVFQTLSSLVRRAEQHNARFLIQTRRPEARAIQAALAGDTSSFLDAELAGRAAAFFPPFCRLALLTFRSRPDDAACEQAKAVARSLATQRGVTALGPVPDGRGAFRLLVKLPKETRLDRLVTRAQVETKRVGARIDVDPLEVV